MGGLLLRFKEWWQSADRTQKLIAVAGSGFLVVLLVGTFVFASRPKMSLLFTNLDPADTGTVAAELESMGIQSDFDDNGNIRVPSNKVAQARASLAMKGKMPKGGNHLVEDFGKVSPFGDTKVVDGQVNAIVESELAEAIQYFDGVDSATVQVTPAVDSPFEGNKKAAMANVTVSEKSTGQVTQEEARAMANLVAAGVAGLDKSHVTIFTRTGRALWDGQDMQDSMTVANNRLDLEKREARKRRDELQEALNRMLGPGNAIAMVDLSLDTSQESDVIHTERPGKPLASKSIDENSSLGGNGLGSGASGLSSNNPADSAPAMTGGANPAGGSQTAYKAKQTASEFAKDTTDKQIQKATGDLKSMAVTVLVNKTDKIVVNPSDPKDPIVSLANASLGSFQNQPGFTATVVTYPFDTSQADVAKKAEDAASSSNRMQQILSILPIAALILVGFLVMKSIGKLSGRPMAPMLVAAGGPALSMSPHGTLQALAGQAIAGAKSLDAANRFVLPEIVKQKALEAGISEEQLQAAIEEAGESGISVEDIPSIKAKINVPLEQIKKMANEKPEMVAMLVKSWLIEEGIRR
ncbi:MAG TPA: flagellar M-ring protein FliF C-terminal domain-containing protein [Fimbriimonadaceae bacterium]|nr:flagellar M-ring protein FliF C-terminal domain-containing protein [Fimbriimonadaceae bacterium]